MTAMWIGLATVGAVLLVWRLRRAAALLERIVREERDDASTAAECTGP